MFLDIIKEVPCQENKRYLIGLKLTRLDIVRDSSILLLNGIGINNTQLFVEQGLDWNQHSYVW